MHLGTYCSAEGRERSFPPQRFLGYMYTQLLLKYGKNAAPPTSNIDLPRNASTRTIPNLDSVVCPRVFRRKALDFRRSHQRLYACSISSLHQYFLLDSSTGFFGHVPHYRLHRSIYSHVIGPIPSSSNLKRQMLSCACSVLWHRVQSTIVPASIRLTKAGDVIVIYFR